MSMSRKLKKKLMAAALSLSLMGAGTAYAETGMPQGGSVVTATAPTGFNANPADGAAMTATANTLINWDSFNLGSGKSLTLDPNGFVFMHQVTGATQSEIMGLLNGGTSGHLIIANPNGIFVNGATINASHLTLTTMQNLDATGFGKLTSGGWGPEVDTNGAGVGIVNSTITVNHYLGVLAGNILIDDHVTVNTQNSTIDLTAVKKGQYSLLMGRDAFYSNGVQYTTTSNGVKIGSNTVALNANGNSYNQIHVLGGQVAIGDYAQLNTGSNPDMSNVLVEAVATKNDSESDPDKVYTGSLDNVINMGLVNFSNGNFALVGGNLTGETESFQDKFTKVSGDTPTPPGPEPGPTPTPTPTPTPSDLTSEQEIALKNALDAQRENNALKALQDAVSGSQKNSETGDYVTVQSGGDSTGGLNIAKGLEGLTVKEASARVRSIAKDYMKALNSGNKAEADRLKEALKEANNNVKILKENEKKTKEEAEKAAQRENAANAAQEALRNAQAEKEAQREEAAKNAQEALLNARREKEQQEELKELAARAAQEARDADEKEQQQSQIQQDEEKPSAPPLSELIQQFGTEQQKQALQQQQQKQQQQGGGTVITTAGEQKDAGSKINDLG